MQLAKHSRSLRTQVRDRPGLQRREPPVGGRETLIMRDRFGPFMSDRYECELCGETFSGEQDLEAHLEDYHGGD